MTNPFRHFMVQDPPNLIGRDDLVSQLLGGITESRPVSHQIISFRTLGSSAILRYLAHPKGALSQRRFARNIHQPFAKPDYLICIYLDCNFYAQDQPFSTWLWRQLKQDNRLGTFDSDFPENDLYAIKHLLIETVNQGRRVVLLLDHFENALRFIPKEEATELRPLVDLSAIITATEKSLVEIKEDAASSWFGGQLFPLNLPPMSSENCRDLIEAAYNHHKGEIVEYYRLLPNTGYYPHYVLTGAAHWFELRQRYPSLEQEALGEIWENRLLTKGFYSEFFRFWTHIEPLQQESLIRLVKSHGEGDLSKADRRDLDSLMDMGLVVWELKKKRFLPFSGLWEMFIKLKAEEHEVKNEKMSMGEQERITDQTQNTDFTQREEELLNYLHQHPQQICLYSEILDHVWHERDTTENRHLLRQIVLRVRRKLPNKSFEGTITNHRNKGYEYRP